MMLQQPSAAAAGPIDISSSAGTCQRFASHLQLHLSTVTVLLAAAWALILHAASSVAACIASGVSNHTAAVKAHLLMLKQSSPSRFYRTAAAKAAAAAVAAAPQHALSADKTACNVAVASTAAAAAAAGGAALLRRRSSNSHSSGKGREGELLQHAQHSAHAGGPSAPSRRTRAPGSCAGMAVARIPMQLQEHRGRLTIALDLDETLLCTYRIEHCPGRGDTLQLVPANRPAAACAAIASSGSGISWASLLGRSSTGGGSGGGAGGGSSSGGGAGGSSSSGGSSMGRFTISTQCPSLPGDLGAAAGASAWMHYNPPPPLTRSSSSGSSSQDPPQQQPAGSHHQQQQQVQLPGPHTLAVFLRPGWREFLALLSTFAEVVLFTAASPEYGAPLAELLDPAGQVFRGRLFADACVSCAGRRGVKDLQVLGRDVRRVVLVDNCLFSFLAQPRNGLPCLPFHGATGDGQLLGVILPLLRSLSQVGGDIRPLLDSMFRVRQWLQSKGYSMPGGADEGLHGV